MADEKKVEAKAEALKKVHIEAVFGDIVHPFTATRFEIGSSRPHELDSWVQIQLDAGKIKLAE